MSAGPPARVSGPSLPTWPAGSAASSASISAGSSPERSRGDLRSARFDVDRDVAHPQSRGQEGVLDGVGDLVPGADRQVGVDPDLDVDEVAQAALADPAPVKADHAGNARGQGADLILQRV